MKQLIVGQSVNTGRTIKSTAHLACGHDVTHEAQRSGLSPHEPITYAWDDEIEENGRMYLDCKACDGAVDGDGADRDQGAGRAT